MRSLMFNLYLALNMLLASLIPGGRPRETISGRLGRSWPYSPAAEFINALHWREIGHCENTARLEAKAREALCYPS